MKSIKCKFCGSSFEVEDNLKIATCPWCKKEQDFFHEEVIESKKTIDDFFKEASLNLEKENWQSVIKNCDCIIDIDPDFETAYLYKLLADYECKHKEDLINCRNLFDKNENYLKLIEIGSEPLKEELQNICIEQKEELYQKAENFLRKAQQPIKMLEYNDNNEILSFSFRHFLFRYDASETFDSEQIYEALDNYKRASFYFKKLDDYRDSKEFYTEIEQSIYKVDNYLKALAKEDRIAKKYEPYENVEEAIRLYEKADNFLDAKERLQQCEKLNNLMTKIRLRIFLVLIFFFLSFFSLFFFRPI